MRASLAHIQRAAVVRVLHRIYDLRQETREGMPNHDGSQPGSVMNAEQLQAELKSAQDQLSVLTTRQQRLAELLKCTPERIEHDLRNVLNELQLLRTIFEGMEK